MFDTRNKRTRKWQKMQKLCLCKSKEKKKSFSDLKILSSAAFLRRCYSGNGFMVLKRETKSNKFLNILFRRKSLQDYVLYSFIYIFFPEKEIAYNVKLLKLDYITSAWVGRSRSMYLKQQGNWTHSATSYLLPVP